MAGHCKRAFFLLAGLVLTLSLRADFAFVETDRHLILTENGIPVLVFNHGVIEPPEGKTGTPRTGYIHPLHGPDGDVLTDDFPADHPHHRGLFYGWPRLTVLDQRVDYWHLRGLQPEFEEWGMRWIDGPKAAFTASNLWKTDDGLAAVREKINYTVRAADETGRVIDLRAVFTNLTDQPLTIAGSPSAAYGGLNIRMDGDRPDVVITTARGEESGNVNAVDPPTPWADHSSRTGDGGPWSGVAIFQHPANPGYPAKNWTLRPYGFLGAAWPGESNHRMEPGETLELRHRLFVHRGTAEEAGVAERFKRFLRETQPSSPK